MKPMHPERMTQEKLAEIEKRCEAASPAPWTIHNLNKYSGVLKRACEQEFLQVFPFGDACFIAGARQDIPALLSHVRAVEGDCETHKRNWELSGRVIAARDAKIEKAGQDLDALRAENLRLREALLATYLALSELEHGEGTHGDYVLKQAFEALYPKPAALASKQEGEK